MNTCFYDKNRGYFSQFDLIGERGFVIFLLFCIALYIAQFYTIIVVKLMFPLTYLVLVL